MHTRVISATASEAPYVLDGLHPLTHRTSLRIAEHYTDTAGRGRLNTCDRQPRNEAA